MEVALEDSGDSHKINHTLRSAEAEGSWANYAVTWLGLPDTGDALLDDYIKALYEANESVHRRANQLALKYDVDFFSTNGP